MASEIERKFLLKSDAWRALAVSQIRMRQNYLAVRPTVRVRLAGDRGFFTVKGGLTACSRLEYEYPIPAADAAEMLNRLCEGHEIRKTRHLVPFGGKTWEIDVFEGENAGLVLAEIELASEDEAFELPPWIGEEVTGQRQYYNSALSRTPWTMRNETKG